MLNDGGSVSEGSGMNLFIVSDDVVLTPPVSAGILEGITRNSVIELLRDEGVEVREVDLARGALYAGDEMFLTGTAAEVTPIRAVDGRLVGEGQRGPVTKKAQELFAAAVAGKLDDYRHWIEVDGRRISHTMDPRNGVPVRNALASVTVVSPRCMDADAYATALMVLGEGAGRTLAQRLGLDALFVVRDGDALRASGTGVFDDA